MWKGYVLWHLLDISWAGQQFRSLSFPAFFGAIVNLGLCHTSMYTHVDKTAYTSTCTNTFKQRTVLFLTVEILQKHNLHSTTTFSLTSLKCMHFSNTPNTRPQKSTQMQTPNFVQFLHKCWHFTSQGFHWSTKGDACGDIRFYHWAVLSQIKQMTFSDWCPELCLNGAMAAIWQFKEV